MQSNMFYLMKCYTKTIVIILVLLQLMSITKQDLPVHCLVNKIEGDWIIHMGDNHSDQDLKCGHKRPDQNLDHYEVDVDKALKIKYETIVHLERPNYVQSIVDNSVQLGKWTMIYDEGFEFTINDQVFFAFNKYEKEGKFSASNTDTEDTPGYKSVCEKTFIGWYHNSENNQNWGCFWAEKITKRDIEKYDKEKINYIALFKPLAKKSAKKNNKADEDENNEMMNSNPNSNEAKKAKKGKAVIPGSGSGEDIFNLLDDASTNKEEVQIKLNHNNNKRQSIKVKPKEQVKESDNNSNSNTNISNTNTSSNSSGENSYVDFIKSLGWDSNSNNFNNIPHLDIYFLNNMGSDENNSGNFLEMDETTKYFTPDMKYIDKVNNPKNGYMWHAKVYDDFVGKSYNHMRNLLGNANFLKSSGYASDDEEQDEASSNITENKKSSDFLEFEINLSTNEAGKVKEKENTKEKENDSAKAKSKSKNHYEHLPENFDWRNVDGANYDSPIRKQGECGSCYAIAAVSVMEARIRIKTNNRLKPILSPSSIISCSRYNQGCAGGYPYLVGKFGREFGFVDESCQPYNEADDKCYDYCFHQKKWKIKDYGYVGEYYGGCDEESMVREIYENGPIIVAINATPELYYYSHGIFHSEARKTEGKLEKNVRPWEYTNHAVVCIGWGEETVNGNTVKFWILKNSWGASWGEKGYFRLNRGTDMASVEAQGVYITPDLD